MLTVILAVVGAIALIVLFILAFAAMKSPDFRIERKLMINSKADALFSLVNNFKSWAQWSPYEKLDPGMSRTYSGPDAGVGAVYEYSGNDKVGAGRMEITESTASSKIMADLHFFKPFRADNVAEFLFAEKDGGTEMIWAMTGKYNFMAKVMCLFIDMDKLVGKDFEKGLQNLKQITESA